MLSKSDWIFIAVAVAVAVAVWWLFIRERPGRKVGGSQGTGAGISLGLGNQMPPDATRRAQSGTPVVGIFGLDY